MKLFRNVRNVFHAPNWFNFWFLIFTHENLQETDAVLTLNDELSVFVRRKKEDEVSLII